MNVKPKVVQTLTSHVFSPSFSMEQCIMTALQCNMTLTTQLNHGALLKLMAMNITLMTNGDTVTETVFQVEI